MILGKKIKELRSEKAWSQNQLAEKLNIRREQISTYERGQCLPTVEVLVRLADVFEVSTDFLLHDNNNKSNQLNIKDRDLLKQFEELDDQANDKERKQVKELIETILWKIKLQKMVMEGKV